MRKDRRQKQEKDLNTLIGRVWKGVSHYRAKIEDLGLVPEDVRSLDDLHKLPFTTKEDLRDTYPVGLLACDGHEIVRYHASSGTTGKPTIVAYTAESLEDLSCEALERLQERAAKEIHSLPGIR